MRARLFERGAAHQVLGTAGVNACSQLAYAVSVSQRVIVTEGAFTAMWHSGWLLDQVAVHQRSGFAKKIWQSTETLCLSTHARCNFLLQAYCRLGNKPRSERLANPGAQ